MGDLTPLPSRFQSLSRPDQLFPNPRSGVETVGSPTLISPGNTPLSRASTVSLSPQVKSGGALPALPLGLSDTRKPLTIQLYPSYGNEQTIHIKGRVMETEKTAQKNHSRWETFKHNLRSLSVDEQEHMAVDVTFNQRTVRVQTNEEGMFQFEMKDFGPVAPGYHHVQAALTPESASRYRAPLASGMIVIQPKQDRSFGVVSDIDDTIVKSDVTDKSKALKNLLLNNEHSSTAFPGMAVLYQILDKRSDGAVDGDVTYLSGSPIGLANRLENFLTVKGFPQGAMELKKMGFEDGDYPIFQQTDYKPERLRQLFNTYPEKSFFLFGDNGEADPEIYRQINQEFPGRVLGIYINNVTQDSATAARYAGMKLSNNAAESAQDLFLRGVISQQELNAVQQAVQQGR